MSWFARYTRSSIGAKHVMAVTGLLLLLFSIVHMIGHLQMFGGRSIYNSPTDEAPAGERCIEHVDEGLRMLDPRRLEREALRVQNPRHLAQGLRVHLKGAEPTTGSKNRRASEPSRQRCAIS